MPKTESEKLLEEYFLNKGLVSEKDFFYERDLGKPKKIDFYVERLNTLFEVTEFNRENDQDKLLLQTRETKGMVRLDSYSLIRNKIDEKREQFKPYKEDYVCVLVLHRGDSIAASLEPELLAGAMFGDISMRFSSVGEQTYTFFGRNGALKPSINRTFSAVAVVQEVFPDRKAAAAEFWRSHKEEDLENLSVQDLTKKYEAWSQSVGYDLEKRVISLRVLLNPFAKKPMEPSFFDGPLDEVFSFDESGRFTQRR